MWQKSARIVPTPVFYKRTSFNFGSKILAVSIQTEKIRTPQKRGLDISSVNALFCQAKSQTQNMVLSPLK